MARSHRHTAFLYGYWFFLLIFYFVPERFYGTTIELLEAKLLRIVEILEQLLLADELNFSEAAYFQTKEKFRNRPQRAASTDRFGTP